MKKKIIVKMMKKFLILCVLSGIINLNTIFNSNKKNPRKSQIKKKQESKKLTTESIIKEDTPTKAPVTDTNNVAVTPIKQTPTKPQPKQKSTPITIPAQNKQSSGFLSVITNNKIESVIVATIIAYVIYYAQTRGHVEDAKEYLAETGTKIKELFKKLKRENIIPVKNEQFGENNENLEIIKNLFSEFPIKILNKEIAKRGFFQNNNSIGNISKINLNLNERRIELTVNINGEKENIIHITPNNFYLNENNQLNQEEHQDVDNYTIQFFGKDNKTKIGEEVLFSDLKTILKTDSKLNNQLADLNKNLEENEVIKSWHDKIKSLVEEENKRIEKQKELEEKERIIRQNKLQEDRQRQVNFEEWKKEKNNFDTFAKKEATALATTYLTNEKTKNANNNLKAQELTQDEITKLSTVILKDFNLDIIINSNVNKYDEFLSQLKNNNIEEKENIIKFFKEKIKTSINSYANKIFSDINLKKFIENTIQNIRDEKYQNNQALLLTEKKDTTDYSRLIQSLINNNNLLNHNELFYGNSLKDQQKLEEKIDNRIVPEIRKYIENQEQINKKKHEEEEKQKKITQEAQKKAEEAHKKQKEKEINKTITEMAHHHNLIEKNKDHTTKGNIFGLFNVKVDQGKKKIFDNSTEKYKKLSSILNTQFKDLNNETKDNNTSYSVTPNIINNNDNKYSDYHSMTIKKHYKNYQENIDNYKTYHPTENTTTFKNDEDVNFTVRRNYESV